MKNQVIEVLNIEHGKKVIEYWKSKGINCADYVGSNTKERDNTYRYYGIIDGNFSNYSHPFVTTNKAEIITLPEEKTYPKVMYVSDDLPITENSKKRIVFMEKCGKYIAWGFAETIKDSEESLYTIPWQYAVDISDIKKSEIVVEMTMEEVCKELGKTIKIVK